MASALLAPSLSVAVTVILYVPAVVGVPVIAPVEVLRTSPGGRLPEAIAYESIASPLVRVTEEERSMFTAVPTVSV